MRILLLAVASLLFYSCGNGDPSAGKMIFRYNEPSGITSLDPVKANSLANIWVVQQLFNGLVQLDSNLRIQPAIARKWEISEDQLTYTFYLRDDVYFHHNECFGENKNRKVIARDVVFSFDRIMEENGPSWVFSQVASDGNGNKKFRAISDSVVEITLEKPYVQFLGLLAMPYCFIVPEEAVDFYGDDFRGHPVGTGPFMLRKWHENEKLVLNRNDRYFEVENGKRLPLLDGIAITFIRDRQTAFLEFIQGRADFLSGLDVSYKDELLTAAGELNPRYAGSVRLQKLPYLNTEYLGFRPDSASPGVLGDKRIRQALNYALDRERLVRYLRNGIGIPGHAGIVPSGMFPGGSMIPGYTHHPARVIRLVNEAGYASVADVPPFTLYTDVAYADICTGIISQWKEAGFRVSLDVMDRPTLKSQVAKGQLGFFRASWIADYPDAENYLSLFYSANFSPAGPNYTHFSNREFDRLYEACRIAPDDSARRSLYLRMDSLVMAESPVIILYYDEVLRFTRKQVRGLGANPMNHLDLRRTTVIP